MLQQHCTCNCRRIRRRCKLSWRPIYDPAYSCGVIYVAGMLGHYQRNPCNMISNRYNWNRWLMRGNIMTFSVDCKYMMYTESDFAAIGIHKTTDSAKVWTRGVMVWWMNAFTMENFNFGGNEEQCGKPLPHASYTSLRHAPSQHY